MVPCHPYRVPISACDHRLCSDASPLEMLQSAESCTTRKQMDDRFPNTSSEGVQFHLLDDRAIRCHCFPDRFDCCLHVRPQLALADVAVKGASLLQRRKHLDCRGFGLFANRLDRLEHLQALGRWTLQATRRRRSGSHRDTTIETEDASLHRLNQTHEHEHDERMKRGIMRIMIPDHGWWRENLVPAKDRICSRPHHR